LYVVRFLHQFIYTVDFC